MKRRKRATQGGRGADGRAGVDLAWLVVTCTVLAALAMRFRVIDRVMDWSKAFATFNLDGIIALFVLVPIAATIFSYRRYKDAMSVRGELARLSLHDSLTGLPNRLFLHDWLMANVETSRRSNSLMGVMFIDLDRFKMVNDTYGHEIGDDLMVAVADRLKQSLRVEDRVVRYGGDEFVVICPEIANAAMIERMAARLIEELEKPFTIGSDSMRISTSIGITLTDDPNVDPEDIVREADVAMYTSKSGGTGQYTVFDPKSHGNAMAPLTAEARLREALTKEEFRLYYQPVVNLDTGLIAGVEALLRWDDPEVGIIPPDEFIPVLEDTGLIVPVGTWVLEEACRQARKWRDEFPEYPTFKVTVNVSARQLAQADFPDVVTRVLRDTGAAHGQICLEITEGALMFDVASAWAALRHAKSLGVLLALDDFGTGYSSLSYVRRFALDMLKIDRSFVEGLGESAEDTAIVEHVIGMARALGMVTVGEGVERPNQVYELRRLGCDLAQGYVFSKPIPAAELDALLRDTARARTWANLTATAGPDGAPLPPVSRPSPLQVAAPYREPEPSAALADPAEQPEPARRPLRAVAALPEPTPEPERIAAAPARAPTEVPAAPAAQAPAAAPVGPVLPKFREFRPQEPADVAPPGPPPIEPPIPSLPSELADTHPA